MYACIYIYIYLFIQYIFKLDLEGSWYFTNLQPSKITNLPDSEALEQAKAILP